MPLGSESQQGSSSQWRGSSGNTRPWKMTLAQYKPTPSGELFIPGAKLSSDHARHPAWCSGNVTCKRRSKSSARTREEAGSPSQSSSSANSHRRRRLLAAHHKHFLGGDRSRDQGEEDEGHSLMTTPTITGEAAEEGEDELNSSNDGSSQGGRILPVPSLTGDFAPGKPEK